MTNLNAETPPGFAAAGNEPTLTRGQVATRLGISPERVRQLTIAGRLPCTETPLGRLYRDSDVRAFAHERQNRTQVGAE
jgi:excisionase family DNA binding protein